MADFDKNMHFNFDLVDTVIVRESNYDLHIGDIQYVDNLQQPSITTRREGDKLYLDFIMPIAKGGIVVDRFVSASSSNPIQNNSIKSYVDGNKPLFWKEFFDVNGQSSYEEEGCFKDYQLLFCRGKAHDAGVETDFTVILRYTAYVEGKTSVRLSDGSVYSDFAFDDNGFTLTGYNGETPGKIVAVFGLRFF